MPCRLLTRTLTHLVKPLSAGLLVAFLLLLGVASLVWNLIAAVIYPFISDERGRAIGRAVIAYSYRAAWAVATALGMLRLDSTVLDRFRDEPGLIIVANHPSMLDALILVARLPHSACIMKAGLMKNIFLGSGARLARYIRNDSARSMVRLAVEDLKNGGQLVVFPEGTRTTREPVDPFRPGVTLIAKLAGAPVQTVFIDTDSPYLRKGWPLWKLPPFPITFAIREGARFAASPDSDQLLHELEQYFAAGVKRTGAPG
ncbi:lysophospholipid acyltransferase family protein [soil metagenome]